MEMHQLRYAVAVARSGNFSRAAEQCHVSQPSLSQQIQKLERELGERLFERTRREIRTTPHGEAFLRRALRILEEVDAAQREAKDAKELLSGSLTLGILPTIAPYLLPKVMTAFMKKFPGVEIIVQEETTSRLLKLAHSYEIDFAIVSLPISPEQIERFEVQSLLSEELLLALPPNHPLLKKRTFALSDLSRERLIVMQEGHCLGDQAFQFFNRCGLQPTISFRGAQLETIQSLVSAGMGLSLIPAMARNSANKTSPIYRSLYPEKPERVIVSLWPRQRPPGRTAAEFLKALRLQLKGKSCRANPKTTNK